jgi:hypothetical protein
MGPDATAAGLVKSVVGSQAAFDKAGSSDWDLKTIV